MGKEQTVMEDFRAYITVKDETLRQGAAIVQKNLDAAMQESVLFLEGRVKKYIIDAKKIGVHGAKGGFLASVGGEVQGKGSPAIKGIVFTGSPYGIVIDKGRTPQKKMPPEGTLLSWMVLKMGIDEEQAKKLEFVVRRKIGQKGFPGAHVFERAWNDDWAGLQRIFDNMGLKITREMNS
jgi:hypothetical protein